MKWIRKKFMYWLAPILWAIMIYILSAQSALPEIGPRFPGSDKLQHLMLYVFFSVLIMHALRRAHHLRLPVALLLTVFIASAYGATDELHQSFVPNRNADVADWMADTIGGLVAGIGYYIYDTHRSAKTAR